MVLSDYPFSLRHLTLDYRVARHEMLNFDTGHITSQCFGWDENRHIRGFHAPWQSSESFWLMGTGACCFSRNFNIKSHRDCIGNRPIVSRLPKFINRHLFYKIEICVSQQITRRCPISVDMRHFIPHFYWRRFGTQMKTKVLTNVR